MKKFALFLFSFLSIQFVYSQENYKKVLTIEGDRILEFKEVLLPANSSYEEFNKKVQKIIDEKKLVLLSGKEGSGDRIFKPVYLETPNTKMHVFDGLKISTITPLRQYEQYQDYFVEGPNEEAFIWFHGYEFDKNIQDEIIKNSKNSRLFGRLVIFNELVDFVFPSKNIPEKISETYSKQIKNQDPDKLQYVGLTTESGFLIADTSLYFVQYKNESYQFKEYFLESESIESGVNVLLAIVKDDFVKAKTLKVFGLYYDGDREPDIGYATIKNPLSTYID